jgi:hypothetical protein
MLVIKLAAFLCLPVIFSILVSAQKASIAQATVWANKPDIAAF